MGRVEALAWLELESQGTGVSGNGLEVWLLYSDNKSGATGRRRRSIDEWERLSTLACAILWPGNESVEGPGEDEQGVHDIRFDAVSSGDMARD